MKMRRFAAVLTLILLLAQTVTAQAAAPEDGGSVQVDKFATVGQEDLTLSLPSTAPESGGSIQIDKFSGEELDNAAAEVGGNRIVINENTMYDREKRAFVYQSDRNEVYSNVAGGMTVTEPVWLLIPDGMPFHLYRNGELLKDPDCTSISQPGAYTLTGDEIGSYAEIMHFTVVNQVTGNLSRFQVPDGFVITSALLDGVRIDSARTYTDMTVEGEYDIAYRCPVTEVVYMFRIAVDHTPPQLALAAVREDGTAKGPVDISDLEKDAQIGIWLNNEMISYEPVLTRSGRYRVVVTDAAGNMTDYAFTIRVYYSTPSIIFFIAVLAIGVGIGIYALYSRKHMRIR